LQDVIDKLEGMTLGNVAGGEAERQFQERLVEALEYFSRVERISSAQGPREVSIYETPKGLLAVPIRVEVMLVHDFNTGFHRVAVRSDCKEPKRALIVRSAYLRDGELFVENEPTQAPLALTPTRNGTDGGDTE
jgi:hypothetical protein